MAKLPNAKLFKSFKCELNNTQNTSTQTSNISIDLDKFYNNLSRAKDVQQELAMHDEVVVNPSKLMYKNMFTLKLLSSFPYPVAPILNRYIGYSTKYQSLTISVLDEQEKVQAIAIQKATTKDGTNVKWKSYGSKIYISYKIQDNFIFIGVGMKELVLFEMMKVSYIHLQSDSMVRHISNHIISQCRGKSIIILKENDSSFNKIVVKLQELFYKSEIFVIDVSKIVDKEDIKGYDFVDYCNDTGDISIVERELENEIIRQIGVKNEKSK